MGSSVAPVQQGTNPLEQFLQPQGANPLEQFITSGDQPDPDLLDTARADKQNIQDNLTKLQALRTKTTDPTHQAVIDKLIDSFKSQLGGGWKGALGVRPGNDQGVVENLARGAAAGVATGPDLVGELAGSAGELFNIPGAKTLRQKLSENAARVTEVLHPEGVAGAVGEFAGQLPAQMLTLGPIAGKALEAATKIAPALAPFLAAPKAAGIVRKIATGAAGGAVAISPIAAISAAADRKEALEAGQEALKAGQMTQDQYDQMASQTNVEAIKNFALQTLGGAAFAAAEAGGRGAVAAIRPTEIKPGVVSSEQAVQREADLQAMNAKAAAEQASKMAERQTRRLAQAQWTIDNPEKDWKGDLTNADRKKVLDAFKAKQAAAPEPAPVTTKPVQQATVEQAQAELSSAQAGGTVEEQAAATAKLAETQQAASQVAPAAPVPGTDSYKGGGGLKPEVADLVKRMKLRDAYDKAGLQFDEQVPLDEAQAKLEQAIPAKAEQAQSAAADAKQTLISVDTAKTADEFARMFVNSEGWSKADRPKTLSKLSDMVSQLKAAGIDPTENVRKYALDQGYQKDLAQRVIPAKLQALQEYIDSKPSASTDLQAVQGALRESSPTPVSTGTETASAPLTSAEPTTSTTLEPQVPTRTFLTGVEHQVPLEEMSTGQIDKMKDVVADGIEEATTGKDAGHRQQLLNDLKLLGKETQRRASTSEAATPRPYKDLSSNDLQNNREALEAKITELSSSKSDEPTHAATIKADLAEAKSRLIGIKTEISTRKIEARAATKQGPAGTNVIEKPAVPEQKPILSSDFRKPTSRLSDEDVARQIEDINSRLSGLDPRESHSWQERLGKLVEEAAKRTAVKEGPDGMPPVKGGIKLQVHPATTAFAGGFIYGLIHEDSKDPKYLSRAFEWGLGSAGLVVGSRYLLERRTAWFKPAEKPSVFPNLPDPDQVRSVDDLKGPKVPTITRLREFYRGIVRGPEAIEQLTKVTPGGYNVPTQANPGKLAAMFGRFAAQSDSWLSYKPSVVGQDGNVKWLEGKSLQDIIGKLNKSDLDNLIVAYTSAERAGKGPVPFDPQKREYIIRNAPQEYVDAAKELRQFHGNLLLTQVDAGLLSEEGAKKMLSESWYGPMQRVIETLDTIRKARPDVLSQPIALKGRKGGSTLAVKSPTDVTADMVPRMLRAAEYANLTNSFVERIEQLPSFVRNEILRPVSKSVSPKALDIDKATLELRKALDLSEADAKGLISYIDSETINGNPGIIQHYRNGEVTNYRVMRPDLFQAFKSLTNVERDDLFKAIGTPTRLVARGTVLDPMFTLRRGIIETWLGTLGSDYGFRPILDQIPAWWQAFTRSQKFRELQAVGGVHSVQSLQGGAKVSFGGDNAASEAWRLTKELHPIQAWKTLAEPVVVSARVAEYLAALRHGASTLEAAYAANNLLGNVKMQGYYNTMRGINQLSLFSRPTISHIDRLVEKSGLHPFRVPEYNKTAFGQMMQEHEVNPRLASAITFMTKGFATITLPSMALWYASKDDEEINQVRRTALGSHYWFIRNPMVDKGEPGSIVRIPKPQVLGEFFGGSVEATLDKLHSGDPDGIMRAMKGMADDAAINILPQIGVVPAALWANRDTRFGTKIVPGSDEGVDPSSQGYDHASELARIISDKIDSMSKDVTNETLRRSLSPAGIDYIFNTFAGMMGQDALSALNSALLYKKQGYLPSKEELPLISRLLARYPSMNTFEAQTFYDRDQKVQAAAQTVNKLIKERPELLGDYYSHNMDRIQLIQLHSTVRQAVADYRRAIDDVKAAPIGQISQEMQLRVEKTFTQLILDHMKIANQVAKQMGSTP